jgi:uncharacterized RDD family membrane protein YckC
MNILQIRGWAACLVLAAAPFTAAAQEPLRTADTALERQSSTERELRFARPIVRVAQDFTLAAGDVVRQVNSVFGDVTLEGRVTGDVLVIIGSARVSRTAVVDGSLVVIAGGVVVEDGAAVHRDLVVVGGALDAPPGFSPGGDHVAVGTPALGAGMREVLPWLTRGLLWGRLIVPDLRWVWAIVGILFLVYLVLNTVLDRPVAASADVLAQRPLSAFIGGLIVLLLTIPVLTIVAASVIGLAVVPFLLCALVAAALVGKTAVARAIGRAVLRPESPDGRLQGLATFTIGFALVVLAYMVPIVGIVTWALTSVLALGAATATFRTYLRRERPAPGRAAIAAPADAPEVAVPTPAAADVREERIFAVPPPVFSAPAAAADAPGAGPALPRAVFAAGLAQYPRATFLDRVAAFALDCLLVAIMNAVLGMDRYEGFFLLLLLVYHIAFWAWKGTTLGGIICSLRVIRTHGVELRPVDAVVRGFSSVFSIAALGIGCLWMLQDPERQMWHDKIAGTLVVKVPRELVLP